jgi:alpha-L-fucosidase
LDRTLVYSGDFVTPEKIIPPAGLKDASGLPLLWESCLSINDNWGFVASDRNFKPAGMLIRKLVECVSKGGNMLLNVGPDARGNIPEPSLRILSQIGRWMKRNHAGIYQCGPAKYPKPQWGWFTQNGRKLYAHVLETSIGPHAIDVPPERVKRVRLLANGAELPVIRPWNAKAYGNYTFVDLGQRGRTACVLPDEVDTVLEIELKD